MTQRPIKFRAWDKANKRWFYPPSSTDSSLGSFMMTSDGRVYIEGVYQELVLCQYTGKNDKKGVEIYEGDLMRAKQSARGYVEHLLKIEWDDEHAGFRATVVAKNGGHGDTTPNVGHSWSMSVVQGWAEVIGNVFENGDLLPHA